MVTLQGTDSANAQMRKIDLGVYAQGAPICLDRLPESARLVITLALPVRGFTECK